MWAMAAVYMLCDMLLSGSRSTPSPGAPRTCHLVTCLHMTAPHCIRTDTHPPLAQVDGESHVVHVEEEAAGSRLTIGSLTVLAAKEADPSRLLAASPGKLVRHLVAAGSHLQQNQPYAEVEVRAGLAGACVSACVSDGAGAGSCGGGGFWLHGVQGVWGCWGCMELLPAAGAADLCATAAWVQHLIPRPPAHRHLLLPPQVMKMMMPLLAPASGTITFELPEGAVLAAGDVIARLDLDDPSSIVRAREYSGALPELGPPVICSDTVDYRFKEACSAAKMIMAGGGWGCCGGCCWCAWWRMMIMVGGGRGLWLWRWCCAVLCCGCLGGAR